ncbi:hypothetical protein SAMN05443252_101846 [Bacillus sp. OV322]|uniref:hypothetical protein n=1 Tax=Bacillus sp. OV322 TaxID=1882764 RepID=UPI0008E9737A|nr:hypothetical protein [Bacillus sp. OV322]SFC09343.1 hypothetical protein SAMN05443252_101846 [Bacillus sp. OV322]
MDYIQTVEEFPIYFPVFEATMRITSERLIDFDPFTKFVFQMLGSGKTIAAVEEVTELRSYIILEEVYRLQGWGFFEEDDGNYNLTKIGQRYLKLMSLVDDLNEESRKVLVNAFNGKVIGGGARLFKADECMPRLKVKVVKELLQNKNFSNSHAFFVEHVCFTHPNSYDLSKEELESIQVWIDCDPRTQYYGASIKEVPVQTLEKEFLESFDMAIQTGIIPITIKLHHPLLEEYRHVWPTLKQLKQFDSSLLSEKAEEILELQEILVATEAVLPTFYYEQLTGNIVSSYDDYSISNQVYKLKWEQTNVPDQLNIEQLPEDIDIPPGFEIEFKQGDIMMRTTPLSSWFLA